MQGLRLHQRQLHRHHPPARNVKCKTSIYDDYNEEPENGLLYYENNPVTFSVSARSLKGDELTYQWYRKNNEIPTAAPYKLPEVGFTWV